MNRRTLLEGLAAAAAATQGAGAVAASQKAAGRVVGANDRINLGVIGLGTRGPFVAEHFQNAAELGQTCVIVSVCDVWQKRVTLGKERFKAAGTLDYREILDRSDIDAVVVATPDHWHAKMAIEAMRKGKDVYLEKPMCHTIEEARQLVETVAATGRVLQVGSQTTSGDQWAKARQAIADGMLGPLIMSQGSYHRNSFEGEWNRPVEPDAKPEGTGDAYVDWKMWLGPATKRSWDPERFFRFRKFWDYSGGVATDLFYHVVAPMNVCWGEAQFPHRVTSAGGVYCFKDREVPDTFHIMGDYKRGHSLVLTSSMANSQHIPGLIRGHGASLIMVEHGRFEGFSPYITLKAEVAPNGRWVMPELQQKYQGQREIKIPVEKTNTLQAHVNNFLACIRSRQKPQLDVETGARAQVLITMGVEAYRQSRVLYFDDRNWKVAEKPPMG